MRKATVGVLYRGKHGRPLSRAERLQLLLLTAAIVVGLVVTVVALLFLGPIGNNRLGSVVWQGGILFTVSAGFFLTRHQLSGWRRQFEAAAIVVLALLWLVTAVLYVSER
jgi:hypothetical protein